jgi:hypothetical protein
MAELEIHHEGGHETDPAGKRIGRQAAVVAVMLAIVTILSHRTHTSAIIHKSSSNDQWAYYQATRIKLHNSELGETMVRLLGGKSGDAEKVAAGFEQDIKKYEEQSKDNQEKAKGADEAAEADEHRALRYDLGEGLLEIGLVLSSLYFIARRSMFPVLGLIGAMAGVVIAATGLMM